ncbi:methyltransferase (TIGR00027 family) [Rhizomicrobium palustre]|uniref:S-adenosyl-L-methionine-dependent methyltransferase n=1 Tax=Rhizomicrobium palustre TaxID=189966 RepID=A0A846MWY1_9PROT|nr:class I SAM-dependent methyltransferase [Rhizomicrobium palustre]NIK87749.1 methyltransferase (TIGR00027 family) [Rhizomicrobium palustre]
MQDHQASRTALGVAYIRAAHQILDSHPLLFADPVAVRFLGPDTADAIHGMIARHQHPRGRGLRSHVCLRARFAEDMLAEEAANGATTYVLVGAGFDTFAFRQPHFAKGMRIVEIDHPATQAAKRQMIAAAELTVPENLRFAAADFTREGLGDVLGRLGIDPNEGVYFSWLGVSMYLTEADIDKSLEAMAKVSTRASITLTFRQPPDPSMPAEKEIADVVAAMGEPFISAFSEEAMAEKLKQKGFAQQNFLDPENAATRYYAEQRDLPPPRRTTIVHAAR